MGNIEKGASSLLVTLVIVVLAVAFFRPIIDQVGNLQQAIEGRCVLSANPLATWAVGENFNNGNHVRTASTNLLNNTCRKDMTALAEGTSTFQRLNSSGATVSVVATNMIRWEGTAITDNPTTPAIITILGLLPFILIAGLVIALFAQFRTIGKKRKSNFA